MPAEQDIQREKPVELIIADHISQKFNGLIAPKADGRDKEKDVVIYQPHFYEFKHDRKALETGNIYFEVRNCRLNEPSGLAATKAELMFYLIGTKLFNFDPRIMLSHLRGRVQAGDPKYRHLKGCGDKNSDGVVVPLSEFETLPYVEVEEIGI